MMAGNFFNLGILLALLSVGGKVGVCLVLASWVCAYISGWVGALIETGYVRDNYSVGLIYAVLSICCISFSGMALIQLVGLYFFGAW